MKPLFLSLLILCLALPAAAASHDAGARVIMMETEVDVIGYISGGIGVREREEMEKMGDQFSLKLIFARPDGEFLAYITVLVEEAGSGLRVINAISRGPWFYVDLPEGEYTVTASDGRLQKSSTVTISGEGLEAVRFTFPAAE